MKKVLLALLIILFTAGSAFFLKKCKPVPKKKEATKVLPAVEILPAALENAPLVIQSQGSVEPVTASTASAEVAGRVLSVGENFVAGGDFAKGDELLVIDPADYRAALAQSEAASAQAALALSTERAKAAQAEREWKKIGNGRPATDLVLRKPQLRAAEANLASAQAAVDQATRNLERSKVQAPYNGRIQRTFIDVGSYAAPGAPLVEIYSTDLYEVRLSLSLDDYAAVQALGGKPTVVLSTEAGGQTKEWTAEIVRSEGQIDRASRSVYVVARLKRDPNDSLLVPGLFVNASIDAGELNDVIRIPQKALYGADTVIVIDAENRVRVRQVERSRIEGDDVLLRSGLKSGERICITSLATPIEGMEVEVVGANGGSKKSPDAARPAAPAEEKSDPAKAGGLPQPE